MSVRLFNEYNAAKFEHSAIIDSILYKAAEEIIKYAKEEDLDMRDVQGYVALGISNPFCYEILKSASEQYKKNKLKH